MCNRFLLIKFIYSILKTYILVLLFILTFCCIFFLIIFYLTNLINLKKYLFFNFNNKRVDIKNIIEIYYIIVVKQRYLINNNRKLKKKKLINNINKN